MCCRRRRAARQAWLEERATRGGRCGRGRGCGPGTGGPPSRLPFMGGGGAFRRWQDAPRNDALQEPLNYQQVSLPRNKSASRDVEKGTPPAEPGASRVSFTSGPFGWWRNSTRSDANRESKGESTMTTPPQYESGVPEVSHWPGDKAAAKRESLPPSYNAATNTSRKAAVGTI